jgi:tetratricopeptide (TPR) repeat protein
MSPEFANALAGICDSELALYRITLSGENYGRAKSTCERALSLDAAASPVHVALGNLYRESGEYEASLEQFELALALDSDAVDAVLGQADTLARQGRDSRAEEQYQRAIQLQPNYWLAYTSLGNYLFAQGRVGEAIPYYQRITQLMPDSASALNDLGAAYYLSGDFQGAIKAFQQSIAVAPTKVAYSNLGANLYFLGKFDESVAMYHRAVEFAPDDFELWGNLADAYTHTERDADLAEPMYRNAISLALKQQAVNPADAFVLAALGHYHAGLGQRGAAQDYTAKAMAADPGDMYVHYYAALTWTHLNDSARALTALESAMAHGYPHQLVDVDAGFIALRDNPRFQQLTGQASKVIQQ